MRWLFLLLLMLNGFYYVWQQQEAPLRAKEILPLSLARSSQQDIHLLSESGVGREQGAEVEQKCLYLGGFARQEDVRAVEQRLISLDIQTQFKGLQGASGSTYWLRVSPESRRLVDDVLIQGLSKDFPQLKNKIMSCEGVATAD
ncbi:hypothetical protein ACCD10_27275 [Pseudomonas sp. Pseusp122]|jgi:hypothetical protein|uniref:hypothetical protein n=1 Tax=unclassified Pseudomonas TaxID=196821 RepID=UPI0039A4D2EC